MGIFQFQNEYGQSFTVNNTLCYEAHHLLLGTAPVQVEMGISSPEYVLEQEQPVDFSTEDFAMNPRAHLYDLEFHDGGMSADDMRVMEDYSRHSVNFTLTKDGRYGVIGDSGWVTESSRITWTQHGTTKPDLYDEDNPTGPKYMEPYKWSDAYPWEAPIQDYPWVTPYISDWWAEGHDYYDNQDPPVLQHVEPQSGWADSPTFNQYGIWGNSGFPISHVYLVIKVSGTWLPFAASSVNGPAWFRRSGQIRYRYLFRVN